MPVAALVEKVLIDADQGPCLEHMLGRDPALREVTGREMDTQVCGIGTVRLGVAVLASKRRGVRGLGKMRLDPTSSQLLHDIAPSGAALQREGDVVLRREPGKPAPQMLPTGRSDPTPLDLARLTIDVLERELATVNVERTYDGRSGTSSSS